MPINETRGEPLPSSRRTANSVPGASGGSGTAGSNRQSSQMPQEDGPEVAVAADGERGKPKGGRS